MTTAARAAAGRAGHGQENREPGERRQRREPLDRPHPAVISPRRERQCKQQAAREDGLDHHEPAEVERGRLEREADDDRGQAG
jgi:hypothetical protein